MSTICEPNLECNIQKSLNAVCVANESDVFVYAGAAANIYDPTNRIVKVATVLDLPTLPTYVSDGTVIYVDNLCMPVMHSNGCWLGLDGRLLVGNPARVWTWGGNTAGQLGNPTAFPRCSPVTPSGSVLTWCDASAGWNHSTALTVAGRLFAWGCGQYGALGIGSTVNTSSPVCITTGSTDWSQISAGERFTTAIKNNGTLWTWGRNLLGSLGNGSTLTRSTPGTTVGGGTDWCDVSASLTSTAAVKTNGTLWTWGGNSNGILGDGTINNRNSPGTTAGGGTTWCQTSMGWYNGTAIKTNGTLWTWGNGCWGALGDGTTVTQVSPITTIGGGLTWCQVSAGRSTAAALKTDGTLWTWGRNYCGQLGDGSVNIRNSPGTTIGGGTSWCKVALGNFHTGAVKTDGTLWTWGFNNCGQVGDNTVTNRCSPVTVVGGVTGWCQISSGGQHTMSINQVSI